MTPDNTKLETAHAEARQAAQRQQDATERVADLVGELIRLEPWMTPRTRTLLGAVAAWASHATLTNPPPPPPAPRKRQPSTNQQHLDGVA